MTHSYQQVLRALHRHSAQFFGIDRIEPEFRQ